MKISGIDFTGVEPCVVNSPTNPAEVKERPANNRCFKFSVNAPIAGLNRFANEIKNYLNSQGYNMAGRGSIQTAPLHYRVQIGEWPMLYNGVSILVGFKINE